ncbi:hypothetical protein NUW54_g9992 [Trametes sanguinea]|uniref:Uncharacterized protein n=1 Tax=Trametes sanguinea TaxID=158606 RepID=A0ACC1P2S7_9APHY|nr:hypothetical protein NUW54_g9992 [Trametes sanguinea]
MIASGASSLGYALGAAVGAYLGNIVAQKEHDLIAAVVGDGVFLFGVPASAYWMARRYNTVSVEASPSSQGFGFAGERALTASHAALPDRHPQ